MLNITYLKNFPSKKPHTLGLEFLKEDMTFSGEACMIQIERKMQERKMKYAIKKMLWEESFCDSIFYIGIVAKYELRQKLYKAFL